MRMHIAVHVAERCHQLRLRWLPQVEQTCLSALKGVGQQKPTSGHFPFRVMGRATSAGDSNGSNYLSVVRRFCIRVNDRKKVFVLLGIIATPDKDVRVLLSQCCNGKKKRENNTKERTHDVRDSA